MPEPVQRAAVIGVWAGFGGAAMAAGPLVGGILIQLFDWRSIFLANLLLGMLGMWLTWGIASERRRMPARSLDLAGQGTAIVALGTLIAVLIEAPAYGWRSAPILTGCVVSAAAAIMFLMLERHRLQPMLPLSFFRNGTFSGATLVSLASALTFYGLVFVLSLYFQQQKHYSPLRTGLAFLPLTALVAAGSIVSNRLVSRYGARRLVFAALGLYAAGFLGLLVATLASSYWLLALPMPAVGFAAGLITPAATAALMTAIEQERAGIAAGVLNSARQTGAALGVAIFGAMIASVQSFQAGMQLALWVAAAASLAVALAWRLALAQAPAPSLL
ncbi:MFS transporter [Collimonas arenae]|uniref:MFS transporter n=1 Tax=Collimonas arenae TaxID=279058 RepID=UPI002029CC73|nr:MFS transporter [Collimonas arenae]